MPSHGRTHDGAQELLEQNPRRSQCTSVLSDDTEDIDDTCGQGDCGIDADIEVRVLLCWREGNLQHGVRNSRRVHHGGVVEVRQSIVENVLVFGIVPV